MSSINDQDDEVLLKLKRATYICAIFLCIEIVGGMLSHSLAVLSDAAHLFADLASFAIAVLAANLAKMPPDSKRSFGWKRIEALAALFSVFSLATVTFFLALQALIRIYMLSFDSDQVEAVDGKAMSIIASLGVVINLVLAAVLGEHHVHGIGSDHDHSHDHDHHVVDEELALLHSRVKNYDSASHSDHEHHEHNKGDSHNHEHSHDHHHDHGKEKHHCSTHDHSHHEENIQHFNEVPHNHSHSDEPDLVSEMEKNLNIHAAYLHVLGDLVLSIAVLLSGLLILKYPSWQIADPLCTLFFSVVVARSTISPFKKSISILMNETPLHIDHNDAYAKISSMKGVSNVHDLHIWSISQGIYNLSVHIDVDEAIATIDDTLTTLKSMCNTDFGIKRITVQVTPVKVICDECGVQHCLTCDEDHTIVKSN